MVGFQNAILVLERVTLGEPLLDPLCLDGAVDDHVSDMDTLRTQLPSHALRQGTQRMLGRGRVLTASVIAERLEVSERTIYRDVQDLQISGVPIEGEAGVGYVLRSGYQVPPMMFDEEELQALVFGADVAKSYGDANMAEAADRILAKIDAVLPQRLRPQLETHRVVVPDFRISEEVTETLPA